MPKARQERPREQQSRPRDRHRRHRLLLYFGLTSSHYFVDQASQAFTGRFTQQTMVYIVLGTVALVAGALTAISSRR